MDILERLDNIERYIENAECRYSAKRNRADTVSSDKFRLDALEKEIGINQKGVIKNDCEL